MKKSIFLPGCLSKINPPVRPALPNISLQQHFHPEPPSELVYSRAGRVHSILPLQAFPLTFQSLTLHCNAINFVVILFIQILL